MTGKKFICTALFALFSITLYGEPVSDKKIEKEIKKIFEKCSKVMLAEFAKNANVKKIQYQIEKAYDVSDDPDCAEPPKKTKSDHDREQIKKKQKITDKLRKENRAKAKYEQTKENIKKVFLACIKNNPKKKNICKRLMNAYTQFLTGISLEAFLSMPQKTKSELFFDELEEHTD